MLGAERARLSRRETQLLRYAIQGLTNHEIAGRVRLSAAAVKTQLRSALAKLARRPGERSSGGATAAGPTARRG
jgi:DNA-binding NarL/FixJ family response regulator